MVSSLGIQRSGDISRLRSRPRMHGVDAKRLTIVVVLLISGRL